MAVKLRRPILMGGIGLSFGLWILQSLHHSIAQLGFGVFGAIALGTGFWLLRPGIKNVIPADESPLDRATVEKAIAVAEGAISQLVVEAQNHPANLALQQRLAQLTVELNRQEIHLTVTGGKAVGKTTLIKVLSGWVAQIQPHLCLNETPALFTIDTSNSSELASAFASDLVLFVTNGDLTDSEFQTLQYLAAANQRLVLVFNQQDQYLPEERAIVLHTLQQRMSTLGAENVVVGVATSPNPIKVRQHQPDGSVQEWLESSAPQTKLLTDYLTQIIAQESQQLVWATTKRKAVALKQEAKTVLNGVRRDRTLPIIEQYQWIAAAAAFANPVPALDLLATAAVNAQLVTELGAIYQQKFSLQQAQAIAATMGNLMLKLGLVELSTQTISSFLKSNAITFVAGGALQGVSAAYLTRLAGMSLIEYLQQDTTTDETQSPLNLDQLKQTIEKTFQQNQQVAFLQSFINTISQKLIPKMS